MKKEIEVKILLEDKKETQKKLKKIGGKILNLEFQRTFRCWKPDFSFSDKGIFPRTRQENNRHTFTVKVNPEGKVKEDNPNRKFFKREEYEIEVSDSKELAKMLAILGFSHQRILEKYRQNWKIDNCDLIITIDSLPFADFMEIEGREEEINQFLKRIEFEEKERITLAYWRVYRKYCEKRGIQEKENLTFKNPHK